MAECLSPSSAGAAGPCKSPCLSPSASCKAAAAVAPLPLPAVVARGAITGGLPQLSAPAWNSEASMMVEEVLATQRELVEMLRSQDAQAAELSSLKEQCQEEIEQLQEESWRLSMFTELEIMTRHLEMLTPLEDEEGANAHSPKDAAHSGSRGHSPVRVHEEGCAERGAGSSSSGGSSSSKGGAAAGSVDRAVGAGTSSVGAAAPNAADGEGQAGAAGSQAAGGGEEAAAGAGLKAPEELDIEALDAELEALDAQIKAAKREAEELLGAKSELQQQVADICSHALATGSHDLALAGGDDDAEADAADDGRA